MATKRQKFQVGLFLVSVLIILAVVLATLTGLGRQRLDRYYVEFEETVSGLNEGSRVSYRGVTVGKVLDLRVTPENRVGVIIGVDPAKVTLRKGVKARYSLLSLFGPYVIDLSGGTDTAAPALEPGAFIPVRASVMADLEETLADSVPLALQRVTKLIERLDAVFSKIKPDDLPGLFRRAEDLFENANRAVGDVREQTADLAAALQGAIRAAQADVKDTLGNAGKAAIAVGHAAEATAARAHKLLEAAQATLDETRKPLADALKRLDATLAEAGKRLEGIELAATTKAIRAAADSIGKGADSVTGAVKDIAAAREDIRRSFANVERDLRRTLDDLGRVLRSARDLFDTLERDPSAILRGRRGEP